MKMEKTPNNWKKYNDPGGAFYYHPEFGEIYRDISRDRLYYIPLPRLHVTGISPLPRVGVREQEFALSGKMKRKKIEDYIDGLNSFSYEQFLKLLAEDSCLNLI